MAMTCKDCLHYEVCKYKKRHMPLSDEIYENSNNIELICRQFKNKSKIIELPMPCAECLRSELQEHCFNRCVEEL